MIRYKLTDKNGQTFNQTQWGENVTYTADGTGELCGPGWIHVYAIPALAVLLNPIHANFAWPRLWECECSGECKTDSGLKEGWTSVTTVREIALPSITMEQQVKFAILCAAQVPQSATWLQWARKWWTGNDRSAALAAAWATRAATRAAEAAEWAAAALAAAEWAAEAARAARAARAAAAAEAPRAAAATALTVAVATTALTATAATALAATADIDFPRLIALALEE
jgi:hypothetical protein